MTTLTLKNVTIGYDEPLFTINKLSIQPGECYLFNRPNGYGKTTLLRTLAGELTTLNGMVAPIPNHFISAHPRLYEILSVKNHLQCVMSMLGGMPQNLMAILSKWGLAQQYHQPIWALSSGQKKRLHLLRLDLIHRPLWLLDEPDNHLDADGFLVLSSTMTTHLKQGGSIVCSTHDQNRYHHIGTPKSIEVAA